MSNNPTHIVIHCSDSLWGCAREINLWHIKRGFTGIGYHFVILNGMVEANRSIASLRGSIECGRDIDQEGAHCIGYNNRSISICLVGKDADSFIIEQFDSLKKLCLEICMKFNIPADNVIGHRETDSGKSEGKTCPGFDVANIRMYLKGRL